MSIHQTDSFRNTRSVSMRVERKASRKAVLSAWLGSAFVVPLMPACGVLLGLAAFGEMSKDASLTGKKFAQFGVIAGVLALATQAGAFWTAARAASDLRSATQDAVLAGFAGETDAMVARFSDGVTTGPDAAYFVDKLRGRYGGLRSAEPDASFADWRPGQPAAYTLTFDQGTVPAAVWFDLSPSLTGPVMTIAEIRVDDARFGTLALPAMRSVPSPDQMANASRGE